MNLFLSCEDKITQESAREIQSPALCPAPNPELLESPFTFSGIEEIFNITPTSAVVSWQHSEDFFQYHIVSISKLEGRNIIISALAPKDSMTISKLQPNTEYIFMVRAIDHSGFLETNIKTIKFKTKSWPNFSNQKSLSFNGSQNVKLKPSIMYPLQNSGFTLSLWFKTDSVEKNAGNHMITFHKENSHASTGMAIKLSKTGINLIFDKEKIETNFNYADSSWHFLTLTKDATHATLYIDGNKLNYFKAQIPRLGNHPASLGSYSGYQKGFYGKLDELALFESSMNSLEVAELFNNGLPMNYRLHSLQEKLAHWFQLGDFIGDGTEIIHDSVNGFHGVPSTNTLDDFTNDSP